MAINMSRSLNGDLHEGMTDGRYRKVAPNRGGEVEDTFKANRSELSPFFYGDILQGPASKTLPDASGSC